MNKDTHLNSQKGMTMVEPAKRQATYEDLLGGRRILSLRSLTGV